jgi:hypothetical protein
MNEKEIEVELKKYNVTDSTIEKLKADYMEIKVESPEDKLNYTLAKTARSEIKSLRVQVEKKRKELKEESLNFGRCIDSEAKRIISLLEPIENHLLSQEKIVDDEKERKILEKQKQDQRRDELYLKFQVIGVQIERNQIMSLTDDEVEDLEKQYEEKRNEMLKAQEENRKLLEAQQEKARIEEQIKREKEIEERVKKETEEKIKRELEQKAKNEELKKQKQLEETKKQEDLKPDVEKIQKLMDTISKIEYPNVSSLEAQQIIDRIKNYMIFLNDKVSQEIVKLTPAVKYQNNNNVSIMEAKSV